MLNVFGGGEISSRMRNAAAIPGVGLHWYGKAENRKGRKMGHLTITAQSRPELQRRLAMLDYDLQQSVRHHLHLHPHSPFPIFHSPSPSPSASPSYPIPIPQNLNDSVDVGVIMGSDSDLPCMKACADMLREFGVAFEVTVVSAHRTPERMFQYARRAASRGLKLIIAGAGGAAHLPGMVAAITSLPVIGVPVKTSTLNGEDSLLSIVQMPRGVPVATVAIGNSTNAALLAIRMLAMGDEPLRQRLEEFHDKQRREVEMKAERLEAIGEEQYLSEYRK